MTNTAEMKKKMHEMQILAPFFLSPSPYIDICIYTNYCCNTGNKKFLQMCSHRTWLPWCAYELQLQYTQRSGNNRIYAKTTKTLLSIRNSRRCATRQGTRATFIATLVPPHITPSNTTTNTNPKLTFYGHPTHLDLAGVF